MIAAGSLFTSCIEQVEPLGIQDLRYAKAEYIRALKDLRAADAEYRRAEAAVQQAIARYEDALTAGVNADTEYQKLLNEYQALINEARQDTNAWLGAEIAAKIDSLQKAMEVRELNHKRALAEAEKEMRIAQEDLRVTIRNINLAAGDLTANEKVAIYEAASVYYWLTEKSILYKDSVYRAQVNIDTLKLYKERYSNKKWDEKELAFVGVADYYENKIKAEQEKIDFWMEQYVNMPDTAATLQEWKDWLDALENAKNFIDQESAQLAYNYAIDSMLSQEGIRKFNLAVADFVETNWNTDDNGLTYWEPFTEVGDAPDKASPEYTYYGADSLKIIMTKPQGISDIAWAKFVYLLDSYEHQVFPYSNVTPKDSVITVNTGEDTVTVIVRQDMSEFILGADGNGEDSQSYPYVDEDENPQKLEADYGLLGIYGILKRDAVIGESSAKTPAQIEELKTKMDNQEKKWMQDSAIIKNGVTNFAKFKNGEAELKEEVENNGKGATKMVDAIIALKNAIDDTHSDFANFDGNDSASVFNALLAFAKARESYLKFSTDLDEIDPQVPAKRDSTIFYYSQGKSGAGKPIFAEKKFSALTYDQLKAGEYEFTTANPGDVKKVTGDPDSVINAFANIVEQLGSELYGMFDIAGHKMVHPADAITTISSTDPLKTAMYGKYKIDSWTNPGKVMKYNSETASWEVYVPETLQSAQQHFVDSINAYIAAYRDFWGYTASQIPNMTVTTTQVKAYFDALDSGDADQIADTRTKLINAINAKCPTTGTNARFAPTSYKRTSFKPYADQAPIVFFDGGSSIIETKAFLAVLTAVDPNPAVDRSDNDWYKGAVNTSQIFYQNNTDFYRYMKAASDYYSATTSKPSQNLAKIRAEIKKVEDAIAADQAKIGTVDEEKYEKDVKAYNDAKKKAEDYAAAKEAFTGTRVKSDGDTVLNDVFVNYTMAGDTVVVSQDVLANVGKLTKVEDLLSENLVKRYSGWKEEIAGEQLTMAKNIFGDEPWKEVNEYKDKADQYAEQKADLTDVWTLTQNVYLAAAKYQGLAASGTSGEGHDASIKALYDAYKATYKLLRDRIVIFDEFGEVDITNLTPKVNKATKDIADYAFEAADWKDENPRWDVKIEKAENELEVLKNRQKTIDQALKVAKENYDRLREYLLSQDGVSYVIPVSTADIDDVIMNLDYLLRSLGHTIVDVYAEVGDKLN